MRHALATTLLLLVLCAPAIADPVSRSSARLGLPLPPGANSAESPQSEPETTCGDTDDSQHVENYDGTLGVKKSFVSTLEPSTAQLRWRNDLSSRFTPPDRPGNVKGRWCTGTLIAKDLLLTAAHCVQVQTSGWITPTRGVTKAPVPPSEIATLMQVFFNYQLDGVTGKERPGVPFDVAELVEYGFDRAPVDGERLDYAILRLKHNAARSAGDLFRIAKLDPSKNARDKASTLTIIQHPAGSPKKIDAGNDIVEPRDLLLRYGDIDSLGAASGSGIVDQDGNLIGVHTNGGCTKWGGFNYGVSLHAIDKTSDVIN